MDSNKEKLRRSGLKNTRTRAALIEVLEQSERPLSAEEVFLGLKRKKRAANLSTVYRALEAMAEKELVSKLSITGEDRSLYELNRLLHRHYLVCLRCKKILAISYCPLGDYEKKLSESTGFEISGHKLDVYGYCPDCIKTGEKG